jgi:hypothetical protein
MVLWLGATTGIEFGRSPVVLHDDDLDHKATFSVLKRCRFGWIALLSQLSLDR